MKLKLSKILAISVALTAPITAYSEAPKLKSGKPVIYLADNLDEKDQLGWCIDTLGRGFQDKLQTHSCKPAREGGNDTQFSHDANSGQIRSVPYQGKCMTYAEPDHESVPFHLLDCKDGDKSQQFDYDKESQQIHPRGDKTNCVVAGSSSKSAGPFMSRKLVVSNCESADDSIKQWVVAEKRVEVMLKDPLDDKRGYCLDIAGGKGKRAPVDRGLQAHTCYNYTGVILEDQGFDAMQLADGQFRITYFDTCMEASEISKDGKLMLGKCDNSEKQQFALTEAGQLAPKADSKLCVTVDKANKREGRGGKPVHVMRPVTLQPCSDNENTYQSWVTNSL